MASGEMVTFYLVSVQFACDNTFMVGTRFSWPRVQRPSLVKDLLRLSDVVMAGKLLFQSEMLN